MASFSSKLMPSNLGARFLIHQFYISGEKKLGVSVTQDTWKSGSRSTVCEFYYSFML